MVKQFLKYTSWRYRRAYLWAVTAFTMLIMILAVFFAEPGLAQTIITTGFTALVAFTMTYVFGAVADHHYARKTNEPPPDTNAA